MAGEICHADILNRIFRFEKKSFAVKWNYEKHFTFIRKNSEYAVKKQKKIDKNGKNLSFTACKWIVLRYIKQ